MQSHTRDTDAVSYDGPSQDAVDQAEPLRVRMAGVPEALGDALT